MCFCSSEMSFILALAGHSQNQKHLDGTPQAKYNRREGSDERITKKKEASSVDRIDLIRQILRECTLSAAAVNSFLEIPRKYAADDSLYMREVHFVVAVGPEGSPTISEMASRLNVTQGAVTQMVIRLEKKGYVLRAKNPYDRRQTTVSLTEKGKTLCSDHIAFDRSEHIRASRTLADYSDAELEKIIRYEQLIRQLFTKTKDSDW